MDDLLTRCSSINTTGTVRAPSLHHAIDTESFSLQSWLKGGPRLGPQQCQYPNDQWCLFSWKLCNQPCCHGYDSSVTYHRASTTSALSKFSTSMHMVTSDDKGWLCGGGDGSYAYSCIEGVDFAKNLAISPSWATTTAGAIHVSRTMMHLALK
jgi:hypothetical protein